MKMVGIRDSRLDDWLDLRESHGRVATPHGPGRCLEKSGDIVGRFDIRTVRKIMVLVPDQ